MALLTVDLVSSIQSKLNALSGEEKKVSLAVHSAYAQGIQEYLFNTLEIQGVYAGVIPGTPTTPDPLSGIYNWKISNFILTGVMLQGASSDFNTWKIALETSIKTMTFIGMCKLGLITLTVSLALSSFILTLAQSGSDNNVDALSDLADKVITSLLSTVVTSMIGAAVSSGGGVGTVTMTAII